MRDVYSISGPQLQALLDAIKPLGDGTTAALAVAVDDGGVKFKVNGSVWSPPLGRRSARDAATGELLTRYTVM